MTTCTRCGADRVLRFSGKVSDMFSWDMDFSECSEKHDIGDVHRIPDEYQIVDGDYVRLAACMNCGQLQGRFPREKPSVEAQDEDEA